MASAHDAEVVSTISPVATATQHLVNEATSGANTKSLLSSSRDVLTFPFRAIYRADKFAFTTLPRRVAKFVGLEGMASQLMENTSGTGTAAAGTQAADVMGEGMAGAAAATGSETGSYITDLFVTLKRLSGFFSYLTSRWSLACFTVVSCGNAAFRLERQVRGSNKTKKNRLLY